MLNERQLAFAREYCVDFHATNAAIRAGYSEKSAYAIGSELLNKVEIQIALEEQKACLAAASAVTVEMIVRELFKVATADRRAGCRHCWGIEHKYQWTEREYSRTLDAALAASGSVPEMLGGFGYTKRREPHPDCPECKGEGVPTSSYEVKPPEKMKALEMLGKYKGMFVERKELSGPGGSPLQLQAAGSPRELTDEELMRLASAAAPPMLLEAEAL